MPDIDWQLRLAAFARLEDLKRARGGIVTDEDLDAGFQFAGYTIKFWSSRRGIWRPKQLSASGAALSITTAPPKPGKKPPYDDQIASDADFLVCRYEGDDRQTWTNVAARAAMEYHRPLIYAIVKTRLHQRGFRELVVSAYRERCAVCRLAHSELLDAAHVLPDRDERGRPEGPNGLSLGQIHHGAYDTEILGVDPDYSVHIRGDVLAEEDGPMLLHGLQELHGSRIILPKAELLRPNRDYLAERFGRFKAA